MYKDGTLKIQIEAKNQQQTHIRKPYNCVDRLVDSQMQKYFEMVLES
jgi:hypothetical protein